MPIDIPISLPERAIARVPDARQPAALPRQNRPNCRVLSAVVHTCAVQCRFDNPGLPDRTMPKADLPAEAGEPLDPTHADAAAAQDRRASERLIADWEGETRRLGHALALMTLDVSAMTGPKWAYRFVIAVGPVVEESSFLFYGDGFASLLELPARRNSLPTAALLPARYVPVFAKGCIASTLSAIPVRMQGAVEREDGKQELYRAAFIRLSLDASRHRQLALGAFNCRVADPRAEHPNARPSRSVKSSQ
jgi:hypothetical protein